MAITVATEQAANSEGETAMATSAASYRKSAMGKKAEERAKPMSNPDRSSGFTICLGSQPTESRGSRPSRSGFRPRRPLLRLPQE